LGRALRVALLLTLIGSSSPAAEIHYDRPRRYLTIDPKFGARDRILAATRGLRRSTDEATLAAIRDWIETRLRREPRHAYSWRTFDRMLADRTYGSCADHAVLFGSVAQAHGIPTVWVKTMDVGWIRRFVRSRGREVGTWSGHVFLEQHVDGRWVLVDASAGRVHTDYQPGARILPGRRLAYEKGPLPYPLVLSMRWALWKKQTRRVFTGFDLRQLPVGPGRVLNPGRRVSIVSTEDHTIIKPLRRRIRALGRKPWHVIGNNYNRWLKTARGHTLVVTAVGGKVALPRALQARYLPSSWRAASKKKASGQVGRVLPDGTRVIVVFGRDRRQLAAAIGRLRL
jgi:hypothetical protein